MQENPSRSTDRLLRLPKVLELIPVSRSSWFIGVKSGIYPAPLKIGARATAWRESDIVKLIDSLSKSH